MTTALRSQTFIQLAHPQHEPEMPFSISVVCLFFEVLPGRCRVGLAGQFTPSISGRLESGKFAGSRDVVDIPQPLVLYIEDVVKARQRGNDVAVLLIEMLKSSIVAEDIHALPLREDHADRTVLEDQSRFAFEKNRHLLIDHQHLLPPGAKGLGSLNEKIQQCGMPHQPVDLIDRDDARLVVYQTVAPDRAQDLRVRQSLENGIALKLMEAENTRGSIQSRPPRVRSTLVVPLRKPANGPLPVQSPAISSARFRAIRSGLPLCRPAQSEHRRRLHRSA